MSAAEIGNLMVRLAIDSAEFANGVRGIQGSLSTLTNSLKAFAASAAVAEIGSLTVDAIKSVAEIGDVAESIGVSAEQLQAFQKMALASGTSTDILTRGLQSIAEQSTSANSELSKLFTANGLTVKGKEVNQIIREFMNLIQNARNPAEQLAMITGVLGDKVGRQLVEAFRTGAAGVDQATKDMIASGVYHSNSEVTRLQEIETKYNEVTHDIGVIWEQMVVGLIENGAKFWSWLSQTSEAVINQMKTPEVTAKLEALKAQLANYEAQIAGGLSNRAKVNVEQEIARIKSLISVYEQAAKVADLPDISGASGKSDLAGNINPKTFGLSDTSNLPGPPRPVVPQIPPNSIDDIYGYGDAVRTLQSDMAATVPEADALSQSFDGIASSITDGLVESIQGLITGTMSAKDAFANMANSISQELSNLAAELLKSGIFRILSMALAGPGGAGVSIGGSMFGGLYANGGTLGAGKWGIAGEAGPEIVHGPATITPMSKMGGSTSVSWSPSIVINGSADQRQLSAVMAAEREKFKADLPKMIRDARKRGSI